jgi:ubiquinone/menaquinone biosynthesis C-methylase UbiE
MDSEEQTRAYAEADFSDSNALFVDTFTGRFSSLAETGSLADLGCGPADICIRLARAFEDWKISGIDAGENMLKRASTAVDAAGLQERIELKLSYLPDKSLGEASFDAITSNSLLHHLPDPSTLWDTIARIGRTGAAIMVMDLRRPESTERAAEIVKTYSGDAPAILQEDFYHSLLAAYTPEEINGQLLGAGLEYLDLECPSDRHFLVSGLLQK